MATKTRNSKYVYRLMVDPERVVIRDNISGWILDILVKAGGQVPREDMVRKFSQLLKRRRPDGSVRPSSVLSAHQRILKDAKIIQITDQSGKPVPTRKRVSLVK